jgi:hypothetical protein
MIFSEIGDWNMRQAESRAMKEIHSIRLALYKEKKDVQQAKGQLSQ